MKNLHFIKRSFSTAAMRRCAATTFILAFLTSVHTTPTKAQDVYDDVIKKPVEYLFFGMEQGSGVINVHFVSKNADNSGKAYPWSEPFSVETNEGNVAVRKIAMTAEEAKEAAQREHAWLEMELSNPLIQSDVYIYVVFRTKAGRDEFVRNGRQWDKIDTSKVFPIQRHFESIQGYEKYSESSGQGTTFITDPRGTFGPHLGFDELSYNFDLIEGTFLVMERLPYKKDAIQVKVEPLEEYRVKLNSSGDGFDESVVSTRFKVTYTNTAPYPVAFTPLMPEALRGNPMQTMFDNVTLNFIQWYDTELSDFVFGNLYPYHQNEVVWEVRITQNGEDIKAAAQPDGFDFRARAATNIFQPYILSGAAGWTELGKPDEPYGNLPPVAVEESVSETMHFPLPPMADVRFELVDAYPTAIRWMEFGEVKLKFAIKGVHASTELRLVSGTGSLSMTTGNIKQYLEPTEQPGIYELDLKREELGDFAAYVRDNKLTFYAAFYTDKGDANNKRINVKLFEDEQSFAFVEDLSKPDGSAPGDASLRRLTVAQDNGTWALSTYQDHSTIGSNQNTLLDFVGNVTENGDGSVSLGGANPTSINGLLTSSGTLNISHTGSNLANINITPSNNARLLYKNVPLTTANDFKIEMSSSEYYSPTPPEYNIYTKEYPDHNGVFVDFMGTKQITFGSTPLAETPGLYFYRNTDRGSEVSLTGRAGLSGFLSQDINNLIQAEVNVYDMRFGTSGMRGARGDFSGFVGLSLPGNIFSFGPEVSIELDILPDTRNPRFFIAGGMGLGPIGGLWGELEFKRQNIGEFNLWLPNTLGFRLEAPIPIGPTPVTLSALGAKASGVGDMFQYVSDLAKGSTMNIVPPLQVQGSVEISAAKEVAAIGGSVNFGANVLGLTDGTLKFAMIPVLQNVHGYYEFKDWGERVKIGSLNIPVVDLNIRAGGTINLADIFIGNADITMGFTPSKLVKRMNTDISAVYNLSTWGDACAFFRGNPEISGLMTTFLCSSTLSNIPLDDTGKDLVKQAAEEYKNPAKPALEAFVALLDNPNPKAIYNTTLAGGKSLYTAFTDIVELECKGTVELRIPMGFPFGGHSVAKANVGINLEKVWAGMDVGLKAQACWGSKCFGPDFRYHVAVNYYYMGSRIDVTADKVKHSLRAMPLEGAPHVKTFTVEGAKGDFVHFPGLSAMTPKRSIRPLAFSDVFESTKKQEMQNLSRTFLVQVRSKSAGTGLIISGPHDITAQRTANDIDWQHDTASDYYTGTIVVKLPTAEELQPYIGEIFTQQEANEFAAATLAGEWTVQAADTDATILDQNGKIDCDFFYAFNEAYIENLTYENNADCGCMAASWNNVDLEKTLTYRIKFALVDDSDTTKVYPIFTTQEWGPQDEPITQVSIPTALLENMTWLPNGDYKLRAVVEKLDGDLIMEDGNRFPTWSEQGGGHTAVSFTHVNPQQPAAANDITATAENGMAIISWNAPTDMSNVSGYIISIVDTGGNTTATMSVAADKTQVAIPAAQRDFYDFETDEWVTASLKYGLPYTFAVTTFNEIVKPAEEEGAEDAAIRVQSLAAVSNEVTVANPIRPSIVDFYRVAPDLVAIEKQYLENALASPSEVEGLRVVARSGNVLKIRSLIELTRATLHISEELTAFRETEPAKGEKPTFTDISQEVSIDHATATISLNGIAEGVYTVEVGLYYNSDYHIYNFELVLDNTPPALIMGVKTQNKIGEWILSGATEPSATLSFNSRNITELLNNGIFTLALDDDLSHINFEAVDEAGNITIAGSALSGITSLAENDLTEAVVIDFRATRMKTGATFAATAQLRRQGTLIAPEAGDISWSIRQGGAFASIDTVTGVITALAPGEAVIRARYRGVLRDFARITIASEFPVNDLFVSEVPDEVSATLSFTEPHNATEKQLEYSVEAPVEGIVIGGWENLPATFDNAGNATVTNLPFDKTVYFRLKTTGGLNEGYSNTASRLRQAKPCDHVWGSWTTTVTATCEAAGEDARVCSLCNKTEIRAVPRLTEGCNLTVSSKLAVAELAIYPNPVTKGELSVENEEWKEGEAVEIYNLGGALVAIYKTTGKQTSVNISQLPSGTYVLKVGRYAGKFVKQ